MLVFRQLFDPVSSTYTYLLGDSGSGEAILIDPVFEHVRRDSALVHELGLRLVATVETHVHADHVTGAWLLRGRHGSAIAIGAQSGAEGADRYLQPGDHLHFGARSVQARATPGHTNGCMSYVIDDERLAFTGDALLIRGCGRTDFQQGSAVRLYRSVHEQLLSLPPHCLLYPGHDYKGLTVTSVEEERRHNPRFGGASNETDFAGYMAHLNLPHPKLMDVAVPANLRCGRPVDGMPLPDEPSWAPLNWTFAGLWEITPATLLELTPAPQIVDVREPDEYRGPLGHLPGARLLPIGQLTTAIDTLDRSRPVVTVCRSGTRSAQAALLLGKAGFAQVANLAGGMLRWRAEGLASEGGVD